jgi:hypothetical protein
LSEAGWPGQSEEAHLEQMITVTPASKGWRIRCTARQPDVLFRSGAAAETAAHSLAAEIAKAGDRAVIEIYLRDGTLGGRSVHEPQAPDWTLEVRAAGASVPPASPAR